MTLLSMSKQNAYIIRSEFDNTSLTPEGLEKLALLAAERVFLVLRDQEFKNAGFDGQKNIAS